MRFQNPRIGLLASSYLQSPFRCLTLRHRKASPLQLQRTKTTISNGEPNSSSDVLTASVAGAVGALAGLLGSLAGMGGGFVMIPLMTTRRLPLRLTQHQAHGTSLFAVAATGLAGALSYGMVPWNETQVEVKDSTTADGVTTAPGDSPKTGAVRVPEAVAVALTAMITARWGAQATLHMSGQVLRRSLGCLMLFVAPMIPAKVYYLQMIESRSEQSPKEHDANAKLRSYTKNEPFYRRYLAPAMIGVGSGFLSGLFGVGGGTIVVPALTLCTDLTHHEALATSLAAMILPAISGTWSHYRAGNVAMRVVAPFLAIGALAGAWVGAQLSLATDEEMLRWGFSGLLATLGLRTLLKA